MKWVVGKEYKERIGNSYRYVGPFTRPDGTPATVFVNSVGCLSIRNEDGTSLHRCYDILLVDEATDEEREVFEKLLRNLFNLKGEEALWQNPAYFENKLERCLPVLREIMAK